MTTQIPLQFWAVGLIRISLSLAVLHLQLCVGLLFLCHIPYRFQVKARPAVPSVWYSVGPCLIFCTVQLHFLGKVKFDWVLMIFVWFCLCDEARHIHTVRSLLSVFNFWDPYEMFRPQQLFTNRLWTEGIKFSKINTGNYMQGNIYTLSPYSCYLPLNIIKG